MKVDRRFLGVDNCCYRRSKYRPMFIEKGLSILMTRDEFRRVLKESPFDPLFLRNGTCNSGIFSRRVDRKNKNKDEKDEEVEEANQEKKQQDKKEVKETTLVTLECFPLKRVCLRVAGRGKNTTKKLKSFHTHIQRHIYRHTNTPPPPACVAVWVLCTCNETTTQKHWGMRTRVVFTQVSLHVRM